MEDTINKLTKAMLESNAKFPSNLRLFLLTEKKYLRVFNGSMSVSSAAEEYGIIKRLQLHRGQILDIFAKLEFFLNEMIRLKLLGTQMLLSEDSRADDMLYDLLSRIDLSDRIKLLRKWQIISKKTRNLLWDLKEVRNDCAHKWGADEVKYKEQSLKGNFVAFKKDLETAWQSLLAEYKKEQEKIDIPALLDAISGQTKNG